jgi:urocanate hydratase
MMATFRPVVHMVWIKTKPGVTKDQIQNLFNGMNELRKIPGVISVDYGENFTERARGFNVGLLIHLKDKAALETYTAHPIHQAFVRDMAPFREDLMAMDFLGNEASISKI